MSPPLPAAARGAQRYSLLVWLCAAAVLLVPALVVFVPGLGYPFLALDDLHHVVQNPGIRDLSWNGIRFLFTEDTRDIRYYPLTYLSYALDYHLFGFDAFYFHLTNLLLHVANVLGVALLVWLLFRNAGVAIATALLFSIHPLQVEPVAWVMGRKGVLSFFFFLLGALTYLGYLRWRSDRRGLAFASLAASTLFFLLCCLSKATGVTLPAVLVLIDFLLAPEPRPRIFAFLRRSLPSKLVYLPPALLIAVATRNAAPVNPFATEYPFTLLEWISITGYSLFFYIERTFLPFGLGAFYPLPAPGALSARFHWFTGGTALLLLAMLWSFVRGHRAIVFGLGWYFVTILPSAMILAFYSDMPLLVADRYYYASCVGLFLLLALGVSKVWRELPALRPGIVGFTTFALAALVLLSSAQRATWRNTIAVYENLLIDQPSDEFSYRLALEYEAAGRTGDAFRALELAEQAPHKIFYMNFCYYELELAELYRRKGDFAAAARHFEAALEATPNAIEPSDARTPLAYLYLADLRTHAGDVAGAAQARKLAVGARHDPTGYFASTFLRIAPDEARALIERHAIELGYLR